MTYRGRCGKCSRWRRWTNPKGSPWGECSYDGSEKNEYNEGYCDWFQSRSEEVVEIGAIRDSGQRTEFATGAVRDMQAGKGRCDLLPPAAILRLARHFEAGAKKYGDRNWEKGIPISSFIDSAIRHIMKFMAGETDEDHLCAAAWNLMCAMETEERFGYEFDRGEAEPCFRGAEITE